MWLMTGSTAGTPAHLAFDLRGDPPPLTRDKAPELVIGWRAVAVVALVGEGAPMGHAHADALHFGSMQRRIDLRILHPVLAQSTSSEKSWAHLRMISPAISRVGRGG